MVKDNLYKIRQRIDAVCARLNMDARGITIVAVSKGRTPEQIRQAIESGISNIGENKLQEAIVKYNELLPLIFHLKPVKWHMVGHLQTNKVKEAVRIFDLIQSVDSIHLAVEIHKQAQRINKVQDVLIEVNAAGESSKFGLKPADTAEAIKEIQQLKNINIQGLMTVAPFADDPEKTRPVFKILKELMERINRLTAQRLTILSMGMTGDFEVALEEGSNMLRLGRVIFEK